MTQEQELGVRRRPQPRRLTYKDVLKLKPGKKGTRKGEGTSTARDPANPHLRFIVQEAANGSWQIYGAFRYRKPTTGAWDTIGLGRVPQPSEVEAMQEAHMDQREPDPETGFASGSLLDPLEPFRRKAAQFQMMLLQGLDPRGNVGVEGMTLVQGLEAYLKHRSRGDGRKLKPLAANSIRVYRIGIEHHLKAWLKVPLRKLTTELVKRRHEELGPAVGPNMANSTMRTLRAVWNYATTEDDKLAPADITAKVVWFEEHARTEEDMPILGQLPQWFAEVSKLRRRGSEEAVKADAYLFGLLTGLRHTNLVSVELDHLNEAGDMLHIPKPKSGKPFWLPLSTQAQAVVARQRAAAQAKGSKWLFDGRGQQHVNLYPDRDGFSVPFTLHHLRHAYATKATAARVPVYQLKLLKNHAVAKGDVTAGYVHLSTEELRPFQQQVSDYLEQHEGLRAAL